MKLPDIVQKYINASNENDFDKFVSCFSEEATVLDEDETLTGKKAIGEWFKKTKIKYQQKMNPISFIENKNEIILKANVSGNFEGSPIELSYSLKIKAEHIVDLRIV